MATKIDSHCGRWSVTALLALIPLVGGCGGDDVTAPISNATTSTVSLTTVALPTTTATPTATTVAATTTEVVIPEGALDLGHGVFVPVPDGWQGTVEDGLANLDDGTVNISVQVLERLPGEDPALVTQEYVDTFDADFPWVSYSSAQLIWDAGGEPGVQRYDLHYLTFDEEYAVGLVGTMAVFTRADGLAMVYDIYTWDETVDRGLPDDTYGQMVDSFRAAPLVDSVVEFEFGDPFLVTSVHPTAMVDELIGFTLAEGFDVWDSGDGYAQASNGDGDIEVFALEGEADLDAAIVSAKALVGERYSGVAYGASTEIDVYKGWQRSAVGWSGTYTANGSASTGYFQLLLDPASGRAYAVLFSSYSTGDGSEPYAAQNDMLFQSLTLSLDTVG